MYHPPRWRWCLFTFRMVTALGTPALERSTTPFLWMRNVHSGYNIFVVILGLINRSIKTTITKVFKSVVQVIYTC